MVPLELSGVLRSERLSANCGAQWRDSVDAAPAGVYINPSAMRH